MNEQDTMNNEIEIREAVDSTTEASSTRDSASENDNTPEKGRVKAVKRIVLGVSLPILALIIVFGALFLTLNPSIALQNTLETFGVNIRSFSSLEQKFQSLGAQGYINFDIPVKINNKNTLYSLHTDFEAGKNSGWYDLRLSNSNDQEAKMKLVYNKDFIALGNDDEGYISMPLKDFENQFKDSIFNRENGTAYAISDTLYNDILKFINGEAPEDTEEETLDQETLDELIKILDKCAGILKTDDSIEFSTKPFGFVKKVEYTANKETLRQIIDYLTEEFEGNKKLDALFDLEGAKNEKKELLNSLRNFRASLSSDSYYTFRYTIYGGRITEASFESLTKTNQVDSIKQSVIVKFTYKANNPSIYCHTSQRASVEVGNQVVTASALSTFDLELQKYKNVNTYTFKSKQSIDDKSADDDVEIYAELIHNPKDGKFYLTAGETNEKNDFYLEGNFLIDGKHGKLRFTFTSLITKDINLDWEIIDINIRALTGTPHTKVEHKNVFKMSKQEFLNSLKILPDKEIEEILEPLIGKQSLLTYTSDDKLIVDIAEYQRAVEDYETRYYNYIKDYFADEGNKCRSIYIFNEQTNHYYVLDYNSNADITTSVYYNLPSHVSETYHVATLSGDDMLLVHKLEDKGTLQPTCIEEGKIIKECTVCKKEFSTPIKTTSHIYESKKLTYTADNNVSMTGIYKYCTICKKTTLETDHYTMKFVQNANGKYTCEYTSKELDIGYFKIPQEILDTIPVDTIKIIDVRKSFIVVRIPDGVTDIDTNNDKLIFRPVQTLVIPSSLKTLNGDILQELYSLHAIYYLGTKEEWEKIEIDSKAKAIFDNIDVVFTNTEPTPEQISKTVLTEPSGDLLNHLLQMKKNSLTKEANDEILNKNIFKSIVQSDDRITAIEYDNKNEIFAVVYAIGTNSVSKIVVYDLDGREKISFSCDVVMNNMSIGDGYIVTGCAANNYLYIFDIHTGEQKKVESNKTSYNCPTSIAVAEGKVYFTLYESRHLFVYDFDTEVIDRKTCDYFNPIVTYIPEMQTVLVTGYTEAGFITIDAQSGKFKKYTTDSDISMTDAFSVLRQTMLPHCLISQNGTLYDLNGKKIGSMPENLAYLKSTPDRMIRSFSRQNESYSVGVALLQNEKVNTIISFGNNGKEIVIDNFHGGNYTLLSSGDVLFNTGYGVYIIEAK